MAFAIRAIRKPSFKTSSCQEADQQIGASLKQKWNLTHLNLNSSQNEVTKSYPNKTKCDSGPARALPAAPMVPQDPPSGKNEPHGPKVEAPSLPNDTFWTTNSGNARVQSNSYKTKCHEN